MNTRAILPCLPLTAPISPGCPDALGQVKVIRGRFSVIEGRLAFDLRLGRCIDPRPIGSRLDRAPKGRRNAAG
jgi:hypothetical protein